MTDEIQPKFTKKDTAKYIPYGFACPCGELHEPYHPELIKLYHDLCSSLGIHLKIELGGSCEDVAEWLQSIGRVDDVTNIKHPGHEDLFLTTHLPMPVKVKDDEGVYQSAGMGHIAMDIQMPEGCGINAIARRIHSLNGKVRVVKSQTIDRRDSPFIVHIDLSALIDTYELDVLMESSAISKQERTKLKADGKYDKEKKVYKVDGFLFDKIAPEDNVRKPQFWRPGVY